jgi:plasmid stabilization system protein ParE
MRIEFLEVARAEYRATVDYYDGESPGLGGRFANEIARTLARIVAFPDAWQKLSRRTRRCRTERFPSGVVYQKRGDLILVVAVMHLRREPGYWGKRLGLES